MHLYWLGLLVALAAGPVSAQVWQTGDNSTVEGCSSSCSVEDDGDLECWNKTLNFFQKSLITQLRHYISVQVDIDQWHRRHGAPNGQDFNNVAVEIKKSFESELTSKDTLSIETVDKIAGILSDRIQEISVTLLNSVPHFQCPLPCEYRHDMYRTLFITSIILNFLLVISVVPIFINSFRQSEDTEQLVTKLY